MKKLVLIIGVVILTANVKAQSNENTTSKKEDIVINQSFIDKYNSYELPEDYIDFSEMMNRYGFTSAKIILNAYKGGNIELASESNIKAYLEKVKNNANDIEKLELQSEKDLTLITEN